jgi:SAM-dependent methyltransferase
MAGPDASAAGIAAHYGSDGLADRILAALAATEITADALTPEHLKAVDEFHIGGAEATVSLLDQTLIGAGTRVIDIGSGIGGPARLMAGQYGAAVTGIDLTPDLVATATRLTALVGLDVGYVTGSATDLPFGAGSFDLATLFHVGMNIADKPRLCSEAARVLRPGGQFAIYDVMLFGTHPDFPLPWATGPAESCLARPEDYLQAAGQAGFRLLARRDRGDVARAFFAAMQARMAEARPEAPGLWVLMGDRAGDKVANMVRSVAAGDIAPVEMIFERG